MFKTHTWKNMVNVNYDEVCVCVRIECVFAYYRKQMTWFIFGREPISHV